MPAGLTGAPQAHGLRGETSIAARARLDDDDIEDWSPRLVTEIVWRTVGQVVRGSGG